MISIAHLLGVADAYKAATGITADTTVSYRVFGDSKKLGSLRGDGDITVSRFNAAMCWFRLNWPVGADLPEILTDLGRDANPAPTQSEDAA